jgi:hypothetical protein
MGKIISCVSSLLLFNLLCINWLYAAPSISSINGTVTHGQYVTIHGSSFGTKSTAQPVVWDDCSGTSITSKWSGGWPDTSLDPSYGITYRTPAQVGRNIPLPHSHITKYLCGAHYPDNGPDEGYNVMVWKNRTISTFPSYTFASWYQRSDDNWEFGLGSPGDDNYKCFDYSTGTSPYTMDSSTDSNWYIEYNTRPTSRTSSCSWHLNDDGGSLTSGVSWWYSGAVNPMSGVWTKIEVEICYTSQTSGYIKLWENGTLKINYAGPTDRYSGTARNDGIGGYARSKPSTSNWRYFADLYLDYSRARVIIGNASTFSSSTIREVQVPTSWSDSSVTIKVNQGGFADEATAYLYVVDDTGTPNSAGYPITFGEEEGEEDTTAPTVSITTPNPSSSTTSSISIAWTDSDDVGVTSRKWRIGAAPDATHGTEATSPATITGLQPGDNTVYIGAGDAAGNWGSDSITVNYTPSAEGISSSLEGSASLQGGATLQ